MKKIICTAVSAMALAAFAEGVNSTEFGVLPVFSTAAETIVSIPWLESGTGTEAVKVADLVLTAGLTAKGDAGAVNGDELKYYDGSGWQSWVLTAEGDTKYWAPSPTTKVSTLVRGKALLLKRQNPSTGKFYIMGKPATKGVETPLGTGYSLVAPPSVTETDVNTEITWTNIDANDKLMVPLTSGTSMKTLSWINSKWCKWEEKQWKSDNIKIPAGTGAWFVNSGTGSGKSFTYGNVSAE